MLMSEGRFADLHLHTRWSDGTLGVWETAKRAKEAGLCAIAITDHDTIGPELTAPSQPLAGVEVICGVELKAKVAGERGEILGYFLQPRHPALGELFSWMAKTRVRRMREMIERCNALLPAQIHYEEVAARTGGSVGRPHLAAELQRLGVVATYEEAFARFLGQGMPCYVPLPRPESRQAIAAIRAAGGVAALAHPGFLPLADFESVLRELRAEGMAALEVHYPYDQSKGPFYITIPRLLALARKLGLVPTGGSDDHGPGSVKESLGAVRVPYAVVEELGALAPSVT